MISHVSRQRKIILLGIISSLLSVSAILLQGEPGEEGAEGLAGDLVSN